MATFEVIWPGGHDKMPCPKRPTVFYFHARPRGVNCYERRLRATGFSLIVLPAAFSTSLRLRGVGVAGPPALMRSSNTLAGSSFGSCGTSSPRNALASMAWSRWSISLRALVVSEARRSIHASAASTSRRLTNVSRQTPKLLHPPGRSYPRQVSFHFWPRFGFTKA
jgi:hypothetical protein